MEGAAVSVRQGGWGFAPGTFGEVVQGELQGTPFLITLPIRWGTRAKFVPGDRQGVVVYPPYRKKAQMAGEMACRALGKPGGTLSISSLIPIGKGLASSSADIVASMRAVAAAYRRPLPLGHMAKMAAEIEPSDGVMFPGIVAFNPRHGVLLERLGPTPPAILVGLMGRGRINTEEQYRLREPYTPAQQILLSEALRLSRRGVEERDVSALGRAGQISATVQLERDPCDVLLAQLLAVSRREGWGLIIAHTGTVRGFLFEPGASQADSVRRAETILESLNQGSVYRFLTISRPGPVQGTFDLTVSRRSNHRDPSIKKILEN